MSDEPLERLSGADRPNRGTAALGARVLVVQALTLLALWILQSIFGGG